MVTRVSPTLSALMQEAEQEIQSWTGFSRGTLLRTDSQRQYLHDPRSAANTERSSDEFMNKSSEPYPWPHSESPLGLVVRHVRLRTFHSPPDPPERSSRRLLRRKPSPHIMSLRELRTKESEAQLRKVYEAQTLAYLQDEITTFHHTSRTKLASGSSCESISEEEEEEEEEEDKENEGTDEESKKFVSRD